MAVVPHGSGVDAAPCKRRLRSRLRRLVRQAGRGGALLGLAAAVCSHAVAWQNRAWANDQRARGLVDPVRILAPAQDLAPEGVEAFGDWMRLCELPPGVKAEVCFIFQKVNDAETKSSLVRLVLGYFNPASSEPALIVILPLGTFLAPGLEIRLNNGAAIKGAFEFCTNSGCQATIALAPDELDRLASASKAEVVVFDGGRAQVSIPVSVEGLAPGIQSLQDRLDG